MLRSALLTASLILAASSASAETIAGQASVIDGDTLEIHGQRIRILDIDAPEGRQLCIGADGAQYRCGQQAALALADWISEQVVTCESTKLDRYKRRLAHCAVSDQDLATWLAETGLGIPYRDCKCEVIRAAAERASGAARLVGGHVSAALGGAGRPPGCDPGSNSGEPSGAWSSASSDNTEPGSELASLCLNIINAPHLRTRPL